MSRLHWIGPLQLGDTAVLLGCRLTASGVEETRAVACTGGAVPEMVVIAHRGRIRGWNLDGSACDLSAVRSAHEAVDLFLRGMEKQTACK